MAATRLPGSRRRRGRPVRPDAGPRLDVQITRRLYDKKSDRYFLEWESEEGLSYGIYLLENAGARRTCIAASVSGREPSILPSSPM